MLVSGSLGSAGGCDSSYLSPCTGETGNGSRGTPWKPIAGWLAAAILRQERPPNGTPSTYRTLLAKVSLDTPDIRIAADSILPFGVRPESVQFLFKLRQALWASSIPSSRKTRNALRCRWSDIRCPCHSCQAWWEETSGIVLATTEGLQLIQNAINAHVFRHLCSIIACPQSSS